MAIRNSIGQSASRFLARDEEVQAVIWGSTVRPAKYVFGALAYGPRDYRAIVATTRRLVLFEGAPWTAAVTKILSSADRHLPLGPPVGVLVHRVDLFGTPVYVGRRFWKDMRRADALAEQK